MILGQLQGWGLQDPSGLSDPGAAKGSDLSAGPLAKEPSFLRKQQPCCVEAQGRVLSVGWPWPLLGRDALCPSREQ